MERQTVTGFSVVDHGWEHSQYFQGCGVAFTPYAYVVTGIGDNFQQALEDALDQIAGEFNLGETENLIRADAANSFPDTPYADCGEDWYYHLSIRFNVKNEKETEL